MKIVFVVFFAASLISGIATIGCDSADYSAVSIAKAPDGNLSALLVQRRGHDSLSSDVYYVILADSRREMPNLSRATHDHPILVTTHGQNLGIQWLGTNALRITCAGCGINPVDIMEKRENVDSVSVTYFGFPK
jgi:hypothetical protein